LREGTHRTEVSASSELSGAYIGPLIRHCLTTVEVSAGLGYRRLGSPIAMVIVVAPETHP